MITNNSDQNGRALEYIIVSTINDNYKIKLTASAIKDQQRDKLKYHTLNKELKIRFETAALKILRWLENKFDFINAECITIDRIADGASVSGDVTDIRITLATTSINLSIKHNHSALKHQRPGSLPQQMGFAKLDPVTVIYKEKLKAIISNFIYEVNIDYQGTTLFNEIKSADPNYIKVKLYKPVCKLVAEFLESHKHLCAQHYYSFLVGNQSFYKILVFENKIKIQEFININKPNSFDIQVVDDSYIYINFTNGWKISLRLHTASSRIATGSLKFDTQPVEIFAPEQIINY